MKLLIWGDAQLESRPTCDRRDEKGRSIRFQENIETLIAMHERAKELGCERSIFLGDICEEKEPDKKSLEGAATVFRKSISLGMPVDAIAGNHDVGLFEISSSSIEPLARMCDSKDFTAWHEIGSRQCGNASLVFIPYLHEKTPREISHLIGAHLNLVKEALIEKKVKNFFAFIHYAVTGCKIGKKNLVLPGDYLDADTLCADQFNTVFAGHIHKHQQVILGRTRVLFPGSPAICDHGESEDEKGWHIFDTDICCEFWHPIPQRRRWLTIPWNEPDLTWNELDIVKFTGEYDAGTIRPQDHISSQIKNGNRPEPFFKSFDVKVKKPNRELRGEGVADKGGFREAVIALFDKTWIQGMGGNGHSKEALKLVLDNLAEAKGGIIEKKLIPVRLEANNFLSHENLEYEFEPGVPVLIVGENGKGKTNFLEAILFCLTGETSKRLPMPMLVRQGVKAARVSLVLKGEKDEYLITRTVKLSSTGASHKVSVMTGKNSLADGAVRDTQAMLKRLLGASFTSLKATNFSFQNDPSPLIRAEVSERKAILAEIFGFEPIAKASKAVNDLRLETQKTVSSYKTQILTLEQMANPERQKDLSEGIIFHEGLVMGIESRIASKKASYDEKQAIVEGFSNQLLQVQEAIGKLPDSSKLLDAKNNEIQSLVKDYDSKRENFVSEYKTKKFELEKEKKVTTEIISTSLRENAAKLRTQSHEKKNRRDDIWQESKELLGKITVVEAELKPLESEMAVIDADTKTILEGIQSWKGKTKGTCGECGQEVTEIHIKNHLDELGTRQQQKSLSKLSLSPKIFDLKSQHSELNKEKSQKLSDYETLNKTIKDLEDSAAAEDKAAVEAEAQEKLAQDSKTRIQTLEATLQRITDEGNKLKQDHENKKKALEVESGKLSKKVEEETLQKNTQVVLIAEIKTSIETSKKNEASAKAEVDNVEKEKSDAEKKLAALRASLEELKALQSKLVEVKLSLEKESETLHIHEIACEGLKLLPGYLIDAKLPELEDGINRYLGNFGSDGLSVSIATQTEDGKESLLFNVDNGAEPLLDIAAFSGGQCQRLEQCIKFALADLAEELRDVRLDLLALDEPGLNLDEQRKARFTEIINERVMSAKNSVCLVISHDRKMQSGFGKLIDIDSLTLRENL